MTFVPVVMGDGQQCMAQLEVAVGEVDLVAHRPQTEFFDFEAHTIPDGDEENPGAGIRLNGDDDDTNGAPDFDDFVVPNDQEVLDNDLLKVDVTLEPYPPPSGVRYFLTRSTSAIKVWTESAIVLNNTDEEELVFGASADPDVLWIEAAEPGASVLTLEVRDEDTGDVLASDSIRFFTFSSIVVALGGEGQTPMDAAAPGFNSNLGMFQVATALYDDGYDVHMFDEDSVNTNGDGETLAEIQSAVTERNVNAVAIYGYSHGGGSVEDLADALGGLVQIAFTGYIDAVDQALANTLGQETDRPPGTAFHLNIYQENDEFELGGGPIVGLLAQDIEVNVTQTPWGAMLDHFTIDDDPNVHALITTHLTQRIAR